MILRRLSVSDEQMVKHLLDQMTRYTMLVHGVARLNDGARQFLTATPASIPASAKYPFAVVVDNESIGLVDVIDGYPRPAVAYIGLLAIVEARRGKGWGQTAYRLTETFCRDELRASVIRLAVVGSNPARDFWRHMGFKPTGEIAPFAGVAKSTDAHIMEKFLVST